MFLLRHSVSCYLLVYTGAIGGLKVKKLRGEDIMTEGDEG